MGRQWPPPSQRWRSCPSRATHLGSAPADTATRSGSARVDSHRHDPAVVHPDAPPQYFPPARSVALAEQNSGRPTILDAPWSKPSRRCDRSARDAAEMHSIVDGPCAPPLPPPNGHGSNRASLRAPHPAPRPRLAHPIHGIAAIRQEHWYKPLESHRDRAVTPPSMPGQNLPCPPPTTTRFCHSHCQVFTRRRSQPLSTVA